MTNLYVTGSPKCVTWTLTIFWVLSWLCPLKWVVLVFIRIIISTSRLLISGFGDSVVLTTIFSETIEDVLFTKALEKRLRLAKKQESPLDGTQKNWTQPVYVKTTEYLISEMDDKRLKVFISYQGKLGFQWLDVNPCENLGLKLDDQQLRISIGLRLEPTSVLRIRATVVKELNGTVYTVFVAPRVLVASHVIIRSIFS